jgi:hypothetical protein
MQPPWVACSGTSPAISEPGDTPAELEAGLPPVPVTCAEGARIASAELLRVPATPAFRPRLACFERYFVLFTGLVCLLSSLPSTARFRADVPHKTTEEAIDERGPPKDTQDRSCKRPNRERETGKEGERERPAIPAQGGEQGLNRPPAALSVSVSGVLHTAPGTPTRVPWLAEVLGTPILSGVAPPQVLVMPPPDLLGMPRAGQALIWAGGALLQALFLIGVVGSVAGVRPSEA